jgi:hypothetical protein
VLDRAVTPEPSGVKPGPTHWDARRRLPLYSLSGRPVMSAAESTARRERAEAMESTVTEERAEVTESTADRERAGR